MRPKVGDRVESPDGWKGTIFSIDYLRVNVKRDDGKGGGGDFISGYGNGWLVTLIGDGLEDGGSVLKVIPQTPIDYKDIDRLIG